MTGNIVRLGKDFHVVCDGESHWHRQAQGRAKLEARKIENCNCKRKDTTHAAHQGSIRL